MPETITCPECAKTLRVPDDLLGRTVRCPSCKATFTAEGNPEPNQDLVFDEKPSSPERRPRREDDSDEERPVRKRESRREEAEEDERVRERPRSRRRDFDEEEDERPRRRRRDEDDEEDDEDYEPRRRGFEDRGSKSDWLRVRQGIGLILAAVLTLVGSYLFLICGAVAAGMAVAGSADRNSPGAAAAAGGIGIILGVVAYLIGALTALVLYIVGNCFCLRAPPRWGAKTLAKVSLGLLGGGLLFVLGGMIINIAGQGMSGAAPVSLGASGAGQVISLVGNLLSLAQYVVFLFFLRAVCLAIQDYRLAKQIVYLIVFFIASFVISIVTAVVTVALAGWTVASTMTKSAETPGTSAMAGIGIGLVVGVCFILLFALVNLVWFIIALAHVRGAIKTYLFRRAR
jgi:predicted Zn finger-like uncharacterized protein